MNGAGAHVEAADGAHIAASDPDRLLDTVSSLHREASRRVRGERIELYHRSSYRVRVRHEPASAGRSVRTGSDEGLALRVIDDEGACAFAAASGSSADTLLWLLERARESRRISIPGDEVWASGVEEPLLDRETVTALPSVRRLTRWLDEALARLVETGSGRPAPPEIGSAWIEAGLTAETLVADGGLRASRSRRRLWAVAMVRPVGLEGLPERPRSLASRTLSGLSVEAWRSRDLGLEHVGTVGEAEPSATLTVVFDPEAAAGLVVGLVRCVHGRGQQEGAPAGPAWQILDDPTAPGALVGGSFDDAGFPTRRVRLAGDGRVIGVLEGQGHFRRSSFRDPPAPMSTTLVVEEGPESMPAQGLLVSDLRVHVLRQDEWVLETGGAWLEGGAPSTLAPRIFLRCKPHEMIRQCVGAIGAAVPTAATVITPHLVFEDMERI